MNYYACSKDLTELKKRLPWLKRVNATALQSSLYDLDMAYQNFFRRVAAGETPGYPKYKNRYKRNQSYRCKMNIKVYENKVQLPGLGKVKTRISRPVEGKILYATISRTGSDKYYVSLCCRRKITPYPRSNKAISVTVYKNYCINLSTGESFYINDNMIKSRKRLARYKKQLSRKQKGSNRYYKSKLKLTRCYEHVINQRQDMLHNITTKIVNENDIFIIENFGFTKHNTISVNEKGDYKKTVITKSEFDRQLHYKTKMYRTTHMENEKR